MFAIRSVKSSVVAFFDLEDGAASGSLYGMSMDLWRFCIDRRIVVCASHVDMVRDCRTEFLSRISSPGHAYFLALDFFVRLSDLLPFSLEVVCFASGLAYRLPACSLGSLTRRRLG